MYKLKVKVPKEYRKKFNELLEQLEKNNVVYTSNNGLIKSFSMQVRKAKKNGHLFFSWNREWHKSVISLAPDICIKKTKYGIEFIESTDNR